MMKRRVGHSVLLILGIGGLLALLSPHAEVFGQGNEDMSDCTGWVSGACGAGICVSTPAKRLQTRTCVTPGFPTTQCSSLDLSCCNYGGWVAVSDCGVGCPVGQKKFKRLSGPPTVSGCASPQFECQTVNSCAQCNYTGTPLACGTHGCPSNPINKRKIRYTSAVNGCNPYDGSCETGGCPQPINPWVPYGFSEPSDPTYRFGLPSNTMKSLLGLAAKGNIIIGDYTDRPGPIDFPGKVVPKLTAGGAGAVTRPYAVDSTDVDLGYDNALSASCGGRSPCFDGNYDQVDEHGNGRKWAPGGGPGTPRKFYESSLPDAQFLPLVDPRLMNPLITSPITIDAVLYTNHALAGLVKAEHLVVNGTMISRDDALVFNKSQTINHDPRLVGDKNIQAYIALPFTILRPQLTSWKECPPTGCS